MSTYPVEFSRLEKENKNLRKRLNAVTELAACYRLHRSASPGLLKRLEETAKALKTS